MSASPDSVADDRVTITINGAEHQVRKGAMLIEVTDDLGISVPRFCYHKKLPVAANCRMCLVEVEKAPKPMPACATPVMEGMIVHTQTDYAKNAQRAVMEFLLINHPLDCPICDQGGECELQDVALEYGRGISRFTEKKRVVKDKNFGSLIATDMTRCIHCTRCIRFLEHIGGTKELGGTGRGESLEISTYIENNIDSELSGNIIDVCPVGALTSKPFRFSARAWELEQTPSISPHDCVGSNTLLHTRVGTLKRVVPAENEAVNEVWLSDRDRFGYQGVNSDDRLTEPMIKTIDGWEKTTWEHALQQTINGLKIAVGKYAAGTGFLVSPNATTEEHFLLNKIAEGLGVSNIDHRLRQTDFSDQEASEVYPSLGCSIESLETADAILVVGGNPRKEQPIIGHRIRTAAQQGSKVMFVNSIDYPVTYSVTEKMIATPAKMVASLAAITAAVLDKESRNSPPELSSILQNVNPGARSSQIADYLIEANNAVLLLGLSAYSSPEYANLRALAHCIAQATSATVGMLTDGANSAGAHLAGVLPHRSPAGIKKSSPGLNAEEMISQSLSAYLLFGIEPEHDCADRLAARKALKNAGYVVSMTPFVTSEMLEYADILLPIAAYSETSGTFVNCQGDWQSFVAASKTPGEARPGWKVLRVIANLLEIEGFDYDSSRQVLEEIHSLANNVNNDTYAYPDTLHSPPEREGLQRIGTAAIYTTDNVVRRASALQKTSDGETKAARVSPTDAKRLGITDGATVMLVQGDTRLEVPVIIDDNLCEGGVYYAPASILHSLPGQPFDALTIEKVTS
ncbi:MAG: NADH-quinone oxidoreductase subunit NuoG [Gammaproteobacteria bacterium]